MAYLISDARKSSRVATVYASPRGIKTADTREFSADTSTSSQQSPEGAVVGLLGQWFDRTNNLSAAV